MLKSSSTICWKCFLSSIELLLHIFFQKSVTIYLWVFFRFSILFNWSMCLCLHKYYSLDYCSLCDAMEVLANSMVVITLQYINVLSQHVVHFRLTECYMSIISTLKKRKMEEKKKSLLYLPMLLFSVFFLPSYCYKCLLSFSFTLENFL